MNKEGTVTFWLTHEHPDWAENSHRYNFGEFTHKDVTVGAVKNPDKTLSITFKHPGGIEEFSHAMPILVGEPKTMVALTWTPEEFKLYLNGRPVETRSRST